MSTKVIKPTKTIAAKIDHLGSVDEDLKQLGAIKKSDEPLLRAFIEKKPLHQDDNAFIEGNDYRVKIGKVGEKRALTDVKAVHEMLGDEAFYALATISMKDLDSYLNDAQKKKVIVKNRGGSRTLKYERFHKPTTKR